MRFETNGAKGVGIVLSSNNDNHQSVTPIVPNESAYLVLHRVGSNSQGNRELRFNAKYTKTQDDVGVVAVCRAAASYIACSAILAIPQVTFAGVLIDTTRVILHEAKRDTTVVVKNEGNKPRLIQAWVDDADRKKAPFTVTPPLTRIDANKEKVLRVIRTVSQLPRDCESVFYFNVKEIAPRSNEENVLEFAIHSRLKLFYRPSNLPGKPEQAPSDLKWSVECTGDSNRLLEVSNPGAYHVTLAKIELDTPDGKQNFQPEMIKPGESFTWKLSVSKSACELATIRFTTINDYGGATTVQHAVAEIVRPQPLQADTQAGTKQ
ncbi:hypothetical protein DFQ30_011353 [Apophysomyces sp. BC1015]|nr:hypothetical protein DFQ30_011353 [Apophysomyces sp. BC1015]